MGQLFLALKWSITTVVAGLNSNTMGAATWMAVQGRRPTRLIKKIMKTCMAPNIYFFILETLNFFISVRNIWYSANSISSELQAMGVGIWDSDVGWWKMIRLNLIFCHWDRAYDMSLHRLYHLRLPTMQCSVFNVDSPNRSYKT